VSADGTGYRYVKTGQIVCWPGVGLAAAEMGLLVGVLLVVLAGRLVFVAVVLVGLVAVGVVRLRGGADGLRLCLNLVVFQSETVVRDYRWRATGPGEDGAAGSGVREPRHPLGSGPATAHVELEEPRR
jgi:hypothetical protein